MTERNQAEAALQASAAELRKLSRALEQSSVSVLITNIHGTIEYVNPWFTHVTGYTPAEAIGQNPRLLKSGTVPPGVYTDLWQTILRGREWHGEFHNRKKNGDLYWEQVSVAPIWDGDGTITHFIAVKHDITRRKQLEHDLRQARDDADTANRAKSAFLANMSHELRTPLNAILGFAQIMQRLPNLSHEQCDYLTIMIRNGEHLLDMINQVLDLSKIEAGHMTVRPTTIDLHQLIDEMNDLFRVRIREKTLKLLVDGSDMVPRFIQSDEQKLRQILINLLSNAIKFTEQGCITLHISPYQPESNDPLLASANEQLDAHQWLQWAVTDTGPGITPEEQDNLFHPFAQTRHGQQQHGTGLGLAITQRFVHLLGGSITVESAIGHGSRFTVILPVEVVTPPALPHANDTRQVIGLAAGQTTYRILVVDDLADMRRLLVDLLAPMGFELREASNGADAIALWQSWQPHFIWMDMRMPVMDGATATRHIKATAEGQATIIVGLSASALEEERAAVLAIGCNDFVAKPCRADDVFGVMQRHLGLAYRYADNNTPDKSGDANRLDRTELTAALAALSPLIIEQLYQYTLLGDLKLLTGLIVQIRAQNACLADVLDELVSNFQYEQLCQLIEDGGIVSE
ncbi:MAG: PAS domain S-box protein [Chloroflexaceae bacterium]|nr:PAS domain S-box protein [Chloroflexaceae bacterium]